MELGIMFITGSEVAAMVGVEEGRKVGVRASSGWTRAQFGSGVAGGREVGVEAGGSGDGGGGEGVGLLGSWWWWSGEQGEEAAKGCAERLTDHESKGLGWLQRRGRCRSWLWVGTREMERDRVR